MIPLPGSPITRHSPLYQATAPERDYVPPAIFGQVRAPDPVARADIKDQTAHHTTPIPAHTPRDTTPRQVIRPAPAIRKPRPRVPPPPRVEVLDGVRYTLLATLAALPPGAAMLTAPLAAAIRQTVRSTSQILNRLAAAGRIERRRLRNGVRDWATDWRLPSPLPWPAPPPGHRARQDGTGPRVTLADRIHATLATLPPGHGLSSDDLAARLDVGPHSVAAAARRLLTTGRAECRHLRASRHTDATCRRAVQWRTPSAAPWPAAPQGWYISPAPGRARAEAA